MARLLTEMDYSFNGQAGLILIGTVTKRWKRLGQREGMAARTIVTYQVMGRGTLYEYDVWTRPPT